MRPKAPNVDLAREAHKREWNELWHTLVKDLGRHPTVEELVRWRHEFQDTPWERS